MKNINDFSTLFLHYFNRYLLAITRLYLNLWSSTWYVRTKIAKIRPFDGTFMMGETQDPKETPLVKPGAQELTF